MLFAGTKSGDMLLCLSSADFLALSLDCGRFPFVVVEFDFVDDVFESGISDSGAELRFRQFSVDIIKEQCYILTLKNPILTARCFRYEIAFTFFYYFDYRFSFSFHFIKNLTLDSIIPKYVVS